MTYTRGYRDLVAWQRAMELVDEVYEVSESWPSREQFGLIQQVRRSAVSVPSNIAEGNGRSGSREFRHHLSLAHGSLCEMETQLLIARRRQFTNDETIERTLRLSDEVGRLLRGLMRSLSAQLGAQDDR